MLSLTHSLLCPLHPSTPHATAVSSLGLLEPKLLSTSGSKELLRQTSIIECGRDIFQGED